MKGGRNEPRNESLVQVFCMRCSQVSLQVYYLLFLICGCSLEGLQQPCYDRVLYKFYTFLENRASLYFILLPHYNKACIFLKIVYVQMFLCQKYYKTITGKSRRYCNIGQSFFEPIEHVVSDPDVPSVFLGFFCVRKLKMLNVVIFVQCDHECCVFVFPVQHANRRSLRSQSS